MLSFPAAATPAEAPFGELAISASAPPRRPANTAIRSDDEMRILMLHGVLHLLGMDHETDRGRMARAEARWRSASACPTA